MPEKVDPDFWGHSEPGPRGSTFAGADPVSGVAALGFPSGDTRRSFRNHILRQSPAGSSGRSLLATW